MPASSEVVPPNARAAQTFTAQNTGSLVRGEVSVFKPVSSSGDWVMEIHTTDAMGTPTNNGLGSTGIPDSAVPEGFVTLVGTFSPGVSVQAGQRYAISVRREAAFSVRGHSGGSACPGGGFSSPTSAGSWSGPTALDIIFAVFVAPSHAEPGPPESGPEPQPKADGTLTIDANKGKVEKGRKVTLTGQLDASNESCEQNRQIQLQRRLKSEDDSKFATFTTVQTDPAGNYSTKVKVTKTYFYRAVVTEIQVCDDETSNSQKVRVQKKKAAQEA
jgi:hypothetical protein